MNRSLGSVEGKLDGRIDRKRREHLDVAATDRNIRDLHLQIHRAQFVDDVRFNTARDAWKTAALDLWR
jgi:hypothetical protein